ncbi:CaiB/BaiF CoA-transferase family protein [Massilia sp. Root335]|uniref:CaiB/BaiF CoA transferase family protein n=1 Tax=Massilia sp. Root335 TaxID=1736517 RepID=UPI0006FAFA69|nr:CaiB/BaiF CoA-transferase family protein [Massilia sp. Root335]KQV45637.1 carnitine dehydratase [Massilia sp. Root335]
MTNQGPLSGLRVVEMVGIGPCPFAAMMLADMGADVIRIDRKPDVNPASAAPNPYPMLGTKHDVMARGRRSLALDLKHPRARQLLLDLVAKADALVEGFRPGVMERLGLGPEVCHDRNPKLVYGRVTGWGQHGPLAQAAGHDLNYVALSGMLQAMGDADRPPSPPLNLVGDFGGGGMMLAFGVVCAMLEARTSGRGQVVDAAMTDGAALLGAMMYGLRAHGSWSAARGANLLDGGAPFYATYACADGRFIAVGAIEPQFYARLLALAGADDPAFARQWRQDDWPALKDRFAALFATRTRDDWCALLEGTDACFAPVLDMDEAPRHPHNAARQTFVDVDGVTQPAPAPRFSRTAGQAGPVAAPDGAAILADWGWAPDAIAALRRDNIV